MELRDRNNYAETSLKDTDDLVLPDSYRRSPKNKRAIANGNQPEASMTTHQPGSIVRVSLENFVTYSKSEFWPGPNLNMIIGPNGTGKSTLVCAICLGLGWSPKHLGRAKHISDFVKHGDRTAQIEIELAADPSRHQTNPIIRTRISKDSEAADFYIDGLKSPKKQVQSLARSFAIQVDNLCQFLPQDRVAEFATLSPVRLLEETQRAAAPEQMSHWHASLIDLGKIRKDQLVEQQRLIEQLKSLDARQRAQQADVDRLKQRSTLQVRLAMLQKARPFPAYHIVKTRHDEVKRLVRTASRECRRLEEAMEPRLEAVRHKETYLQQIESALLQRKRLVDRHEKSTSAKLQCVKEREQEIEQHKRGRDRQKQDMKEARLQRAKVLHNIQKLERDIEIVPPTFDAASMNAAMRDKTRQIRELEEKRDEILENIRMMREQNGQKTRKIEELEQRRRDMQSQLGQQASLLASISRTTARGWEWVQQNRNKFVGPIFGPPVIECSVKDKTYAAAVEHAIGNQDLLAFTVTTAEDVNTLQQHMFGTMGVEANIRRTPDLSTFQRNAPCSIEAARQHGLTGWLVDLIDGPEEIIAALCDNRQLDAVGYASRELTIKENQELTASPISKWTTPTESTSVSQRREYGDHAVTSRVQGFRRPQYFTAAPVNRDVEDQIGQQLRDLAMDCEQLKDELAGEQRKVKSVKDQIQTLTSEKDAIIKDKDAKQTALKLFDALPTKLDGEKSRLAAAEEKIAQIESESKGYEQKANDLQIRHAQSVIDYANSVEHSRHVHVQAIEAELLHIEAASDLTQLKEQDEQERLQLAQAELEKERLTAEKGRLGDEGRELSQQCKAATESASSEEFAVIEEARQMTVEEMEVEIESTQAQLEMNMGGNMNVLHEYEQRARKIAEKQAQLEHSRQSLDQLRVQIGEIRSQWEPELDTIVGRISSAFSANFAAISCAGEVTVYKDEDEFDKWAIQIKVKFRDTEALSILDSHRQSGGERSVSTIFYLMALQSLARAPFRVVDEINQGMDPRNER